MKFHKPTIFINLGLLILSAAFVEGGWSGLGFAALVTAFFDFILIVIFSFRQNKIAMKTAILLAGVLLLVGFSICSGTMFPGR